MTIRVLSFDFDGCLFHGDFKKDKCIIKHNERFLSVIKEQNKKYAQVYTFVGSNRQSKDIDDVNHGLGARAKGSCFPAVKAVNDHLGATLDTFLLADIYGDLPDGTSYERAVENVDTETHSDWLFDETKATIMYAQMHKIANQHPNEKIIYDFYDDRGNGARSHSDILEWLKKFYGEHTDLIPNNVTFRIHQYAGSKVTDMATIQGTGFIDSNYRQTVKDMAAQAVTDYNGGIYQKIYVAHSLKPKLLTNRQPLITSNINSIDTIEIEVSSSIDQAEPIVETDAEILNIQPLSTSDINPAKLRFQAALEAIKTKATQLQEKAQEFNEETQSEDRQRYTDAAAAAHALHDRLDGAFKKYEVDHNKVQFRSVTNAAIAFARDSELKNHRGYAKQIFGYAGLAVLAILSVATLGVAYGIAGGINYAFNRRFFVPTTFNTDSINKVEELNESAQSLIAG